MYLPEVHLGASAFWRIFEREDAAMQVQPIPIIDQHSSREGESLDAFTPCQEALDRDAEIARDIEREKRISAQRALAWHCERARLIREAEQQRLEKRAAELKAEVLLDIAWLATGIAILAAIALVLAR